MQHKFLVLSISILFMVISSCNLNTSSNNDSISSDSVIIVKGKKLFTNDCSGCHNFRQDAIGPQLGGLTNEASVEWIKQFIKNPKQIIESGDLRAQKLVKKYKVVMPSFATFTDNEIDEIISFINVHKKPVQQNSKEYGNALPNPIPDSIKVSNLVVGLQLVTQIPSSSGSGKLPLTRITKLDFEPGKGSSFVLDLRGKLYKLQDYKKPAVYMDMAKLQSKFIDEPGLATGFGSFAFHPDFKNNGLLYTTHTEPANSAKADFDFADSIKEAMQWVLTEWKTKTPDVDTFSGKGRELLRVAMVSGVHGMQEIAFNPFFRKDSEDYGLLYIGIGDGGAVENGYPFLAHSKEKIWGTIIRIDPKGDNSVNHQYGIPLQNPFAKSANNKVLKEIYAYGFRNPHRITWSRQGEMLACNIGHSNIESINVIRPGNDYGWPIREGTFDINPFGDLTKVYPLSLGDSTYNITYPVAQYDHDEGKAICGGFEYSGSVVHQLKNKFLFGDIPTGRLFYVNMADLKQGLQATIMEWKISINGKEKTLAELCGSDRVDLHFGRDIRGELYVLTKADGKVHRLVSAALKK